MTVRSIPSVSGWSTDKGSIGEVLDYLWCGVNVNRLAKVVISNGKRFLIQIALWGVTVGMASSQQTPPQTPPKDHAQHSTELPPGAGRDTVVRVCGKCHSPNILVANPRDRQGWEDTITKMYGLGAVATDEDFTEILEYLAKNVSQPPTAPSMAKVAVNKATAAEMETSLELWVKDAEAVVSYRTKNGDFKSLEDLKKIPELDVKKLDEKKDRITF